MKSRLVASVVAVALVAAGVIAATGNGGDTYTITADVEQAPSLFEKGRVMVRGVEVGTITDVRPSSDAVKITMEIDEAVELPAGARLSIVPITVIADRYVQIEPPYVSGPALADGDHIGLDRTIIPAELDDVLEQLKGLLAALEPRHGRKGPLASLIIDLDEALDGRSRQLAGTIEGGAAVLGNLAAREAEIIGLIDNLDSVFIALANRSSEIGIVNERLRLVVEALAADRESLEGTLENIAFLSVQGTGLVEESGDNLGRSFGRLGRVLRTVLRHEASLAEGIRWSNVISQALGATDGSGRGLYAYSGRQAAPGSAGAQYNYRIDTRDTIACERIGLLAERLLKLSPVATNQDIRTAVFEFIPEEYIDDVGFLIDLLLPLCADLPDEVAAQVRAAALVAAAAEALGPERLAKLARAAFEEAGR
jgi:phospholipid/cholesterol/gamma-HCH transport system substrate-binding protein